MFDAFGVEGSLWPMKFFLSLQAVFVGGVLFSAALIGAGLYMVFVPQLSDRAGWYLGASAEHPRALIEALGLDPYRGDLWVAQLYAMDGARGEAEALRVVRALYGMDDAAYVRFRHALKSGGE